LNYRLHGKAPYKAVAVHGGPGAPGSAYTLAKGLAAISGTIEPFQTAHTVDEQVDELASQIKGITNEQIYVLGHSWGAWIALLLTHRYPTLIIKCFLIGSGVISSNYANEIPKRRLAAFNEIEAEEYRRINEILDRGTSDNLDGLLIRLEKLTEKSDNYCVEAVPQNKEKLLNINESQYISVWKEGAKLRSEGYLEKIASNINRPVRVIHGANDPSPIEGVILPLEGKLADFKWYNLPRCGHYPWKEKHAKDSFWAIIRSEMQPNHYA
jgi:pimeloyl-ACP methyl ester carboxylesterase